MIKPERSMDAREEQPENNPTISATLDVSKSERSSDFSDEQPENMLDTSVTFDVAKREMSKEVSFEQLPNIDFIFVALEVLNPDKLISSNAICDPPYSPHPVNIPFMFVTFEVSNEERSRDFNEVQWLNI